MSASRLSNASAPAFASPSTGSAMPSRPTSTSTRCCRSSPARASTRSTPTPAARASIAAGAGAPAGGATRRPASGGRRKPPRAPPPLPARPAVSARAAAAGGELVSIGEDGAWVLSTPLGAGLASEAAVTVARRGEPFVEQERELFAHLCAQASVSAANVDRHHALHRQAITDDLTGLANHRRMQEIIAASVDAYERTGAPAALVLFDLDNFKRINDTHGHQTGDIVLRAVAQSLRANARAGDEVARYGGEELAVVLPDTGIEAALAVADQLRAHIEALSLRGADDEELRVTVSGGVATLGAETPTATALVAAADEALYAAKAGGKNRVRATAPRARTAVAVGAGGSRGRPGARPGAGRGARGGGGGRGLAGGGARGPHPPPGTPRDGGPPPRGAARGAAHP